MLEEQFAIARARMQRTHRVTGCRYLPVFQDEWTGPEMSSVKHDDAGCPECAERELALAAPSSIERHVQDMETALRAARRGFWNAWFDLPARDHAEDVLAIDAALGRESTWLPKFAESFPDEFAALPASGTQTAANAGRNRVAREKGTE